MRGLAGASPDVADSRSQNLVMRTILNTASAAQATPAVEAALAAPLRSG